jgi:hypothetical protein
MSGYRVNIAQVEYIGGQVKQMVGELGELWQQAKAELRSLLTDADFSGAAADAYHEADAAVAKVLELSAREFGGHANFLSQAAEDYHVGDLTAAKFFCNG